jgi:hypothetical protein
MAFVFQGHVSDLQVQYLVLPTDVIHNMAPKYGATCDQLSQHQCTPINGRIQCLPSELISDFQKCSG